MPPGSKINEKGFGDSFIAAVKTIMRGALIVDGIITDVDQSSFTCTVKIGDSNDAVEFFEVPLRVMISKQASFIELPVINTNCLVMFRDANLGRPQIIMVDQTDELLITNNKTAFNKDQLVLENGVATFDKGENAGMVLVIPLTQKLNNLEDKVNDIINQHNTHVHPGVSSGSSSTATTTQLVIGELTPTQQSEIENQKVKQ